MGSTILLASGVVASALYLVSIDLIVATAYADYHGFTSQMVSELLAAGAPSRPLLVILFVPYNLLSFAFAAGVWLAAGANRARRWTAAALTGYAAMSTVGLLWAQMDVRGTVGSTRDSWHIAATIAMSIFIMASIAIGAFAFGRRFRVYSFVTLALVIVGGVLAGVLAGPMPGPTPWLGLAERVNIYATMAWFSALAIGLINEQRA